MAELIVIEFKQLLKKLADLSRLVAGCRKLVTNRYWSSMDIMENVIRDNYVDCQRVLARRCG